MLTKKEHTEITGEYVEWDIHRDEGRRVRIDAPCVGTSGIYCFLEEARAIHAELTELFKLLDEK